MWFVTRFRDVCCRCSTFLLLFPVLVIYRFLLFIFSPIINKTQENVWKNPLTIYNKPPHRENQWFPYQFLSRMFYLIYHEYGSNIKYYDLILVPLIFNKYPKINKTVHRKICSFILVKTSVPKPSKWTIKGLQSALLPLICPVCHENLLRARL